MIYNKFFTKREENNLLHNNKLKKRENSYEFNSTIDDNNLL